MKLWLDDLRPAPAGWTWVKTVGEAIEKFREGGIEEASLDHDLGNGVDGHRLLDWIEMHQQELGKLPKFKVHSMNPVGRQRMLAIIERLQC